MPDSDGGGGHPGPTGGYIHDGADQVQTKDRPQGARWCTLSLTLPEDSVRQRIRRALATLRQRDAVIAGSEIVSGFVVKFRNGKHVCAADIGLAAWEGGTQVFIAIPDEHDTKDLNVIASWLRPVLGLFGAADR
jgi:hypothetical protein